MVIKGIMDELKPVPVWEVMTFKNERSSLGRIVINPPDRMAPLVPHKTGEAWFICPTCGFACLTSAKMILHKEKHAQQEEETEDDDDDDDTLEFKDDIINKNKDHFECHICHKFLVTLKGLKNHHLVHQDQRPEKCKICGATFKLKSYRRKHEQLSHNPAFVNRCRICPCQFEKEQGLKKHMWFYHDIAISVPEINAEKERRKELVSKPLAQIIHRKKPLPEVVHKKQQVAKVVHRKQPVAKVVHRKKPLVTKPLLKVVPCESKPIKVVTKVQVSKPVKKQASQKLIPSVKNKSAKNVAQIARTIVLKKAIKQQQLKRPVSAFDCAKCGKIFSSNITLTEHRLTHKRKREKRYPCGLCGVLFHGSHNVKKHIKATHGDGIYTCYYCPCRFNQMATRSRHCKHYHPNNVNQDLE